MRSKIKRNLRRRTHLATITLGAIRGKARVHHVQAHVHQGHAAGDDALLALQEAVRHLAHTLHAKLQPFIEVHAVKQPTLDVPETRETQ